MQAKQGQTIEINAKIGVIWRIEVLKKEHYSCSVIVYNMLENKTMYYMPPNLAAVKAKLISNPVTHKHTSLDKHLSSSRQKQESHVPMFNQLIAL